MSPAESLTLDLDELEILARDATPGPWESQRTEHAEPNAVVYGPDGDSFAYLSWNPGNGYDMPATAAYIAALNPEVVSELIRLARIARDRPDALDSLLTSVEYLMEEAGTRVIDIEDLRAAVLMERAEYHRIALEARDE